MNQTTSHYNPKLSLSSKRNPLINRPTTHIFIIERTDIAGESF